MPNGTDDIRELEQLDINYFLHPTSSIQQQQGAGPAFIFKEGECIYLEDGKGREYIMFPINIVAINPL
ncbi:hypothetical protein [Metabacillus litoralis]|jgi:putrescine---pyruvate transaminase|uniref:hypothetical protein n=1 Tax=Metabacillus litoralis TaxID=152268 RepID=UPI00203A7379|nr:hypothetical protein [Metabacillus litoralis]MCM3652227.1 hypothetical protein [Metabacillus litoralis]